MDSKKNNSVQFTADNDMADLTDNTINVTESEFLNKLQELEGTGRLSDAKKKRF